MQDLYGASIKGIQGFIFETNKLKEMVGASELVEKICTDFLQKFLTDNNLSNVEILVQAAGNIRIICDEEQAATLVKYFPKAVQQYAPGVTLSQALVNLPAGLTTAAIDALESNLKTQRNKPDKPVQLGLAAVARCPRTGKPAHCLIKEDDKMQLLDIGSQKKRTLAKEKAGSRLAQKLLKDSDINSAARFPLEMNDIVHQDDMKWMAVIHADGNSLGKLLQQLTTALARFPQKIATGYQKFSAALDNATCSAASSAFYEVIHSAVADGSYPLRPIILGGDDLTVVCRADLAIGFTRAFLREFQLATQREMQPLVKEFQLNFADGLTACAGIAFIKESYPFHYAYQLAEELCTVAKKSSKAINSEDVPASLAFHKVYSSFQDDYQSTVARELTVRDGSDNGDLHLDFGPYAVGGEPTEMPHIDDLLNCVQMLGMEDAPRSGLRRWLSELHNDKNSAQQLLNRIRDIAREKSEFDLQKFDAAIARLGKSLSFAQPITSAKTPIFDMLSILALERGE